MRNIDVYLVWGTFAKDADWVQQDSVFRNTLQRELESQDFSPNYKIFDWSGENSHEARTKAAEKLAELVGDVDRIESNNTFFIGHSHGGSVALQAAQILEKRSRFKPKVITLGTPFLTAQRNQVPYMDLILFLSVFIYVYFLTSGTLDFYSAVFGEYDKYFGYAIVAGLITVLLWTVLSKKNERYADRYGLRGHLNNVPTYSLYTVGDEARLVLTVWVVLTFTVTLLWWLLILAMPYGIVTVVSSIFLTVLLLRESNEMCNAAYVLEFIGVDVLPILFFLVLGISILAGVLRRSKMAFGGEHPLWYITHTLRVSLLGNSSSECKYVTLKSSKGLRHNRFYEDTRCIKQIAGQIVNWKIRPSFILWYFPMLFKYLLLLLIIITLHNGFSDWAQSNALLIGGACAGG